MTVEVEYKGITERRAGLSVGEAYAIGAKALWVYGNLLQEGDLQVRIVNGRGEVMSVMEQGARPP